MRRGSGPRYRASGAIVWCCAAALWFGGLAAARATEEPSRDAAAAAAAKPDGRDEARRALERALLLERQSLEQLREESHLLREADRALEIEFNAYKVQNSAHANLLHLAATSAEELERAAAANRTARERVESALRGLNLQADGAGQKLRKAREHLQLNRRQLDEIRTIAAPDTVAESTIRDLTALTGVLSEKVRLLEEVQAILEARRQAEEGLAESLESTASMLDARILERRKKGLFLREGNPLGFLFGGEPEAEERARAAGRLDTLITPGHWVHRFRGFWETEKPHILPAALLFGILHALVFWSRGALRRLRDRTDVRERPWSVLTLRILSRSLTLLGTALFLAAYAEIRGLAGGDSLVRTAVEILAVWLFTRWGLDFLRLGGVRESGTLSRSLALRIRLLLHGVRGLAVLFCLARFVFQGYAAPLLLLRLLFEAGFLAWGAAFWRKVRSDPGSLPLPAATPRRSSVRALAAGAIYLVPAGGLVLDLAGYGALSLFWLVSWGRTAGIAFWGSLAFLCLREWDGKFAARSADAGRPLSETRRPLVWLALRLLWLAWFGLALVLLLFAWGAEPALLPNLFHAMNRPFAVGGMTLRLSGFLYALLAVLFTHTAVRLWRHLLRSRLLNDSGLQASLQDSIITISSYLLWLFGILVALSVLGVGATSLTVAFGALGVGLGFGLQAIFNNFVSGLILLFERPIQTGDAVEINGVWGVVKKINVRSTVVQTFDNASLIIPNSEFISRQVTNWSFKDLTLRRTINVGVAYGSDTRLVRDTLLEIARNTPNVLRTPEPDVLFLDFADSALVFRLRVWTTLNNALVLESNMRYEIDRLFRERDITIAFPQRDVHLYLPEKEEHGAKGAKGEP